MSCACALVALVALARPAAGGEPENPADGKLQDVDAWRQLAELANYSYLMPKSKRWQPGGMGRDIFSADGELLARASDQAEKFDEILQSDNPHIRGVAFAVRELWIQSWRVNRMERQYGDTPAKWAERLKSLHKLVLGGSVKLAISELQDEGTWADQQRQVDINGRTYHVEPMPADAASQRTRQLSDELYGGAIAAYLENEQAVETSFMLRSLRRRHESELAQIWHKKLVPRLAESAGPTVEKPLLRLGKPPTIAFKRKALPAEYGSVVLVNASGRQLTNLTVDIRLSNNFNDKARWCAFFPQLGSADCEIILPMRFQNGMSDLSERIDVDYSYYCDQGRQVNVSFDLGKPPRSSAVKDRSPQTTRPVRERVLRFDRANLAKAKTLQSAMAETYGQPVNPKRARRELQEFLKQQRQFVGMSLDKEAPQKPLLLSIGPQDPDTQWYSAEYVSGDDKLELTGQFVDELERGTVLGLRLSKFGKDTGKRERDFAKGSIQLITTPLPPAAGIRSTGDIVWLMINGPPQKKRQTKEENSIERARFVFYLRPGSVPMLQTGSSSGRIVQLRLAVAKPTD